MMSFDTSIFPRYDSIAGPELNLNEVSTFNPRWEQKNNNVFVTSNNRHFIIRMTHHNSMIYKMIHYIGPPDDPVRLTSDPYCYMKETGFRVSDDVWNEYFSCEGDLFFGVPKCGDNYSIMSFREQKIRMYDDMARTESQTCPVYNEYWINHSHYLNPYSIGNNCKMWKDVGYPRNTFKNRIMYAIRVAAMQSAYKANRRLCDEDFKGLEFPDGLVPIHNVNFFERTEL